MGHISKNSISTYHNWRLKNCKQGEEVYFSLIKKIDGEYTEVDQATSVYGYLLAIKAEKFTYAGGDKWGYKIKIYLGDIDEEGNEEVNIVEATFNILSRRLINTMLTIQEPIGVFKINVFLPKRIDEKLPYPAIWCQLNDEKVEGKMFDPKEEFEPLIERITNKKGEIVTIDTEELDQFLTEKVTDILMPRVNAVKQINRDYMSQKMAGIQPRTDNNTYKEQDHNNPIVQNKSEPTDEPPDLNEPGDGLPF